MIEWRELPREVKIEPEVVLFAGFYLILKRADGYGLYDERSNILASPIQTIEECKELAELSEKAYAKEALQITQNKQYGKLWSKDRPFEAERQLRDEP